MNRPHLMEHDQGRQPHGIPDREASTRHYPSPEFCRTLTTARRAAGLSLRQLAARTGRSYSYLGNLEHGRRAPSLSTARVLIRALELTGSAAFAIEAAAVRGTGRDRHQSGAAWT